MRALAVAGADLVVVPGGAVELVYQGIAYAGGG